MRSVQGGDAVVLNQVLVPLPPTLLSALPAQEAWSPQKVGNTVIWLLWLGLAAGVLLGICLEPWRRRLSPLRRTGTVIAILTVAVTLALFLVRGSPVPTAHFLLAYAAFFVPSCLSVFVWERLSVRFALALLVAIVLGSGAAAVSPSSTDVLAILLTAATYTGVIFILALVLLYGPLAEVGSTYRASRRSSSGPGAAYWGSASMPDVTASASSNTASSSSGSDSDRSWGGGGGDFGGGGANSSW